MAAFSEFFNQLFFGLYFVFEHYARAAVYGFVKIAAGKRDKPVLCNVTLC